MDGEVREWLRNNGVMDLCGHKMISMSTLHMLI